MRHRPRQREQVRATKELPKEAVRRREVLLKPRRAGLEALKRSHTKVVCKRRLENLGPEEFRPVQLDCLVWVASGDDFLGVDAGTGAVLVATSRRCIAPAHRQRALGISFNMRGQLPCGFAGQRFCLSGQFPRFHPNTASLIGKTRRQHYLTRRRCVPLLAWERAQPQGSERASL